MLTRRPGHAEHHGRLLLRRSSGRGPRGCAAGLLHFLTSGHSVGRLPTGTAQDAETTSAITAALLAYYTAAQVDALLEDYRTASAQLAYRTGPDQDVFTTNQITSALVAYRSAADQDTATASSTAAALLSYYTIAQVDGLLAGKLGVTEAASALQIAVRFPDDGGADEVVAAIGEQILGPTDVSLSNWTVRPSSGCSVVLTTHTGVSVDGYTLTLAANQRAALRLPLPARHGLQLVVAVKVQSRLSQSSGPVEAAQHAGEVRVVEGNHLCAVAPPGGACQILPLCSCEVVQGEVQPQVLPPSPSLPCCPTNS